MLINVIRKSGLPLPDEALYRSDYGTTLVSSDTLVSDWTHLAGNRAPQWTAATQRPSWNTAASGSAINGYPTIQTALNKHFTTGSGLSILRASTAATVYAVWRHNGGSGLMQDIGGAVFSSSTVALGCTKSGSNRPVSWQIRETGSGSWGRTATGPIMSSGSIYAAVGRVNLASGSERVTLRVNGTDYEGDTPTTGAFPDANGAGSIGFKIGQTYLYNTIAADIAEIGIYGWFLDDSLMDLLDETMRDRYALSY
jgi:hypothetical protein